MLKISSPKFWYQPREIIAFLLYPLSTLYYLVSWLRKILTSSKKAPMKIVCVGNAVIGGAGKTPIAILIAEIALEQKIRVGFLTRGYGRRFNHALRVNNKIDNAELVGDEPLILAKTAPVYVAKDRSEGIKLAENDGIELIIMDDGMQNHQIKKDLTILVIDGKKGFGNGLLFPAGPLRQSIDSAINQAQCIIITNDPGNFEIKTNKPVIYSETKAITDNIKNRPYVAFAGIANNEKFYDLLESLNFKIILTKSFPDHHYYSKKDLDGLLAMGDYLITTEKDYVKIPKNYHDRICYLPIKAISRQTEELKKIIISK